MKQIKNYLKMINPFNNMEEMPTPLYAVKKALAFLLLYYVTGLVGGEVLIIGGLTLMGYDPLHGVMPAEPIASLIPYYGFSVFLLAAILYCKLVEKRTIKSMGFNKKIFDYLIGGVIAIFLLVIIMGVCCLTGGISYVGMAKEIDYTYMIALLVGLMIQGAAEEGLCRGFLMPSLLKKMNTPAAILISSTAFAFPHFFTLFEADLGYAVVGTVNLYLVSAIFSLLALRRTNIWVACGLHSIWNFMLYGFFGLTLSGSEAGTAGVISFTVNEFSLINGGVYGIESSILTTIVLGAVVVLLCKFDNKIDYELKYTQKYN